MLFKGGRDPHKMGGYLEIFILVSEVVAETKMDDFCLKIWYTYVRWHIEIVLFFGMYSISDRSKDIKKNRLQLITNHFHFHKH